MMTKRPLQAVLGSPQWRSAPAVPQKSGTLSWSGLPEHAALKQRAKSLGVGTELLENTK